MNKEILPISFLVFCETEEIENPRTFKKVFVFLDRKEKSNPK